MIIISFLKKYKISALCVLILCLPLLVSAQNSKSFSRATQVAQKSIWRLANSEYAGTGFFIASNLMLTNFHVIKDFVMQRSLHNIKLQQNRNGVLFTSHRKILKILHVSVFPDLALLQVEDDPNTEYLSVSENFLSLDNSDDSLIIAGYHNEQFFEVSKVDSMKFNSLWHSFYFSTNHSDPEGLSGSPVLDSAGRISGMLFAVTVIGEQFHFSPNRQIINFLNKNLGMSCKNFEAKSCINQALTDLPQTPRPYRNK